MVKDTGLVNMKTLARIRVTVGRSCEYELLPFILAPTSQTGLELRGSIK